MDSTVRLSSLLFVVILAVLLCDLNQTSAQTAARRKVCRGTSMGLAHSADVAVRLVQYRAMYTNCTYIDGNLELGFLEQRDVDLSFLKDITEITGYLLIVSVYAEHIPLTQLRVIRGRTQYEEKGVLYSLFIVNNYGPDPKHQNVGLRELQLISLREITSGNVFFHDNQQLCFINTINWADILPKDSKVVVNETWQTHTHCGECNAACNVRDASGHSALRCWGAAVNMCQIYTKLSCSAQCDNRCMGPNPSDCCHPQCAVGCTGPTNADCLACRAFDNAGRCEPFCPPPYIYSDKEYQNVPNPNVKYAYGTLCVDKCPSHLIAENGACVHECAAGRIADSQGMCVRCDDGICPKQCVISGGESINALSIRNFTGCTVIKGPLILYAHALDGDAHNGIPRMSVKELEILETVQEVSEYVQIQLNNPDFTNLRFLRNLRIIKGQGSGKNGLEIYDTSLTSLDLNSLKQVLNGGIVIARNSQLCYANYIDWRRYKADPGQVVSVRGNRNQTDCTAEGVVCSVECSSEGCMGAGDDQCLSCANFSLGTRCLSSCDVVPNVYQSGPHNCSHCHPECSGGCTSATAGTCTSCVHVRDGPYCVAACPTRKYPDSSQVCLSCHENCGDAGCTGPQNTVGPGGCNSCELSVFAEGGRNVTECLEPDAVCDPGYFRQRLQNIPGYPSLEGKYGCMRCHPLCLTCDEYGLSYCTQCRHYRQDERCVKDCDLDNYYLSKTGSECLACDSNCARCRGPTAADCERCRVYTIFSDLGKGEDGTLPFNCTDKCPQYAPFTHVVELDEGQVNLCVETDYTSLSRHKIGLIAGLVPAIIVIICVVVVIIVVCCRQRALAEKKKMEAAARIMGVETEMQPLNESGIEPNRAMLRLTKESELRRGAMIGAGAFGTVYRGWWVPENENVKIPVAIKVLTSGNVSSQNSEMLEEARIMASVNHKYCIRILGICMTERMMIITQLMSHGCLRNFIKEHRTRINSQVMLNWCTQIAKGMEYLENRGIIHRDLAARNVLVQRPEHVRITDFGLAKLLNNKAEMCSTSAEKMPIKWLALECIRNRVYSHKSDVWSYGVMLWELFTYGETPYGNVRAIDIPNLLEKGERLPQPSMCTIDVFMLMIKCWMLDADSRPSFKDLGNEFEKMAMDPARYLVIENDSQRRLMSVSSDPDTETRELLRTFSLPSEPGPLQMLTAEDYLQPRSNGAATNIMEAPPTPSRSPSSAAEPDSCRRSKRRSRNPFRRSNGSDAGRMSSRYTSEPSKKAMLMAQQQQQLLNNGVPSTPVAIHPSPLELIDGDVDAMDGDVDEDGDNVWVVNNNFSPSRSDAQTGSRHQSSSSAGHGGQDHYLTPRSAQNKPTMYMEFPDQQNSTDDDRDQDDPQQAAGYVHMSPCSAGTFASNPEYFEGPTFFPPPPPPNGNNNLKSNGVGAKSPPGSKIGSPGSKAGSPGVVAGAPFDYYNCPPAVHGRDDFDGRQQTSPV